MSASRRTHDEVQAYIDGYRAALNAIREELGGGYMESARFHSMLDRVEHRADVSEQVAAELRAKGD